MTLPPALIFDLDGTLSDPAEGIGRSINHALAAFDLAPIPEAAISQYIGPPLDHAFRTITGTDTPELIAALVSRFRERYASIGYAENVLYPGIPEALAALSAAGVTLGVCTSKRTDFAERILQLFGLRAHFSFVSGGDIGLHKGEQLRALLEAGTVGRNSTMIGDRSMDVVAARGNGLRSVGVLWGHGSRAELTSAGADSLLESVSQLPSLRPGITAYP